MFGAGARGVLGCLAMGLVVFLVCYGAAEWFGHTAAVATVWPANALALAYTLKFGRTRPSMAACLLTAGAAMALANIATGRPLITTLGFPIANVIEIALAAWFMRDVVVPMSKTSDLRQFFLGAVLAGPLASALIATGVMGAAYGLHGVELVRSGANWLVSDMIGMAIVAPAVLTLAAVERGGWRRALTAPLLIGLVSFLLCLQALIPILFLAFPMVGVAVLRDRDRGAALGVLAVTLAILGAAAINQGPIVNLSAVGLDAIRAVQVFLGSLVLSVYPIAALVRRLDAYGAEAARGRDRAVADSAAKSRVINQVGEELRSPLTGVVTVAEMLKSGRLGDLNERQKDLLVRIAESGAAIEALSREMMTLGEGDGLAGRAAAVSEAVEAAVEAARFRARRSEVSLEMLLGEPSWRAALEAEQLRRLILDAIVSALAAAPTGSTVRVVAGLEGEGRICITVDDGGADDVLERQARFSVSRLTAPLVDGREFDRTELRRMGGDLRFGQGSLGGGRMELVLPRARDGASRAA